MEEHRHSVRRYVLLGIVALIAVIYIGTAGNYQLIHGEEYVKQTETANLSTIAIPAARGEIYDVNGNPLVVNRMGFSVVFINQYMTAESRNATILALTDTFTSTGEEWNDSLPLVWRSATAAAAAAGTREELAFARDSDPAISRLKSTVGLQDYATAQNCFDALVERYGVDLLEGLSDRQKRNIIGVRYEMELKSFSNRYPFTFASDVSESTVTYLSERITDTPGVSIQREAVRSYEAGDVAPHVIGTVGPLTAEEYNEHKAEGYAFDDIIGKSGIELAFEKELRGEDGEKTFSMLGGRVIENEITRAAQSGATIRLTIDSDVQRVAQNALKTIIEELKETEIPGSGGDCRAGVAIVTKVNTGAVVALANYPSYDINDYYSDYASLLEVEGNPLNNRATTGRYQPGSTMKPAIALAGLQEGVITGESTIFCSRKYTYYDDYQPECLGYHSSQTVTAALKNSCNYFFFEVGRLLGIETMNYYQRQLGLGEYTGIEIPEKKGILAGRDYTESVGGTWYPGNTLSAAIGQLDNAMTPIELAMYVSTIANGGTRYQAHLVDSIVSGDGSTVLQSEKINVLNRLNVDEENIKTVQYGMYRAANESGGNTWFYFQDFPHKIACKTGTAQVTNTNSTTVKSPHSLFISYGPYENPEYSVTVVLENGANTRFNSNIRVARMIYDELFHYTPPAPETDESSGADPSSLPEAQAE